MGGVFGGIKLETFSPDTLGQVAQDAHRRSGRELIRRDKNHPCVVMWSIANEPESHTDASGRVLQATAVRLARELDPSRPVGFVNVMMSPRGGCKVADMSDVLMLNRYYVVRRPFRPGQRRAQLAQEMDGWASGGKPIIITEYGADDRRHCIR